jgi:8-oxo-dGTP pyrophosphatase MutT (NUDIX family)
MPGPGRIRSVADRIRRAASLIAGRDGAAGLELLVLERSAASRFLPGYVAFPGGSLDDGDAGLADAWWGSPEQAGRACALRELEEETGIELHSALGGGEVGPLAPDRLVEIAHWIAPEQVPVRFDARFYAVELPTGLEPVPDGGETAAAWWESPVSILDGWRAQRRKLYWPTYHTMLHLAGCRTVAELLALRIDTREPDDDDLDRLPRSVFWQE